MIKLSIVVPIYRVERYIEECVTSILCQMTEEVEVIFVNDATDDRAFEICQQIAGENGIYYEMPQNGGLSAARNAGMEIAKGDYIWFVDSDDYIQLGSIEVILNTIDEARPDIIQFNCNRIDESGNVILVSRMGGIKMSITNDNARLDYCHNYLKCLTDGFEVWRRVYSMKLIKEYKIKFEANNRIFAEDMCFNLYYADYIKNVVKMENVLYNYRIRENSIIGRTKDARLLEYSELAWMVFDNTTNAFKKQNFVTIYAGIFLFQFIKASYEEVENCMNLTSNMDWIQDMNVRTRRMSSIRKMVKVYGYRAGAAFFCFAIVMLLLGRKKQAMAKEMFRLGKMFLCSK